MNNKTVSVPFLINKLNQELLLNGTSIDNINEIPQMIANMIKDNHTYVYQQRVKTPEYQNITHESQYPDTGDIIVGEVIAINLDIPDEPKLVIDLSDSTRFDSLYYSKISDPVIRVNGYCHDVDDHTIHIDKITRLTLGPGKIENDYI